MKVAVIQTHATENKARNVQRAAALVRRAIAGRARFILLPETFNYRGRPHSKNGYLPIAESVPGESSAPFMALAKEHGVYILLGSLFERTPGAHKAYNTSVLIDGHGKITAVYRKIHLFEAALGRQRVSEPRYVLAGKHPQGAYVHNFAIGLSVCYDLRFPELYRHYARSGATVLCVPSCFTKTTGTAHWETLLRARAIENLCYVLAPNQVGTDTRGITCYGNSMIVGPWGEVLARASGSKEEIIYATLAAECVREARACLPSAAVRP